MGSWWRSATYLTLAMQFISPCTAGVSGGMASWDR